MKNRKDFIKEYIKNNLNNTNVEEAMSLFPKGYNILDMSEYYDTFE